jgi:thiamine biosynthesis lipoprotein
MREKTGGRFDPRWRRDGTLDLGAIAKGYAVDLACERTKDAKLEMLVDLGGNLKALSGEWRTAVCGSSETLVLTGGMACATSAEYFRGRHIKNALDGGEPVASGKSVTIVHPSSAMMADALSTVMFIMGRDEGGRFLDLHCPQASAMWLETSCPEANGLSERKRPVCH